MKKLAFILLLITNVSWVRAQVKEESVNLKSLTKRALREGFKFISTNPGDTIVNERSIDSYQRFAGKIIRNIDIEHIGFEKSIYDNQKKVTQTISKLANAAHTNTRDRIIRQHLFFSEGQLLNPNKLADNERFLRDKDFILDSRIIVNEVKGTDSVDLTVITRDVFSLGGSVGGSFPSAPKVGVYDANVGGLGQRIEYTTLIDGDRTPKFGHSVLFRKSSILGSLTNIELGYTQINSGVSLGSENEFAILSRISRPLVSPYSRLAGELEVSRNWSKNVYKKPDSTFLDYNYKIFDAWIGYNIGIKNKLTNRNRHFLAFRAFDYYFINPPTQVVARELILYNNSRAYLTEFTFYRQNFYKTHYIFGFGRTEDVPFGFSVALTSGYVNQLKISRPYGGFTVNYSAANRKGDFYSLNASGGSYLRNNKVEDLVISVGLKYNARLWQFERYKMRNSVTATYTQLINRNVGNWLTLSSTDIPGIRTDSLQANARLALHYESVLFTPWSFVGFRFAPFGALDVVTTSCSACTNHLNNFWGISTGLRTRNENLIFGTMELKVTLIPHDEFGNGKFVIGFKQNLRVKNSGTFARAPSLIIYN